MLDNALTLYTPWHLERPMVPPHSRLYYMAPVGEETPFLESLTSYIIRLAEAHCVSTDTLFTRELLPVVNSVGSSTSTVKRALTPSFRVHAKAINGTGLMASNWIRALEKSTLRKDLRFLTLLTWTNVLSQKYLLRSYRAWCPLCYENWLSQGQTIYDPLLWSLEVVKICPTHVRPLKSQCVWCKRRLPFLDRRSRPGHCSKCRKWLGVPSDAFLFDEKPLESEELNWQLWISNAVGELIAAAPLLMSPPPKERILNIISDCIGKLADGVLSRFASYIQKSKTTVFGWHKGTTKITLPDLLRICYCFKISTFDFLTKNYVIESESDLARKPFSVQYRTARPRKQFDIDKVRQELEKVLDGEYPPPSMQAVAARFGYYKRFLFKHFPNLCREISARHAQYQKNYREQKIRDCRKEIRQAALKLYASGVYPSRRRIAPLLARPGDIERKEVYEELREIRRELGLNQYQYNLRRSSSVCQTGSMNPGI